MTKDSANVVAACFASLKIDGLSHEILETSLADHGIRMDALIWNHRFFALQELFPSALVGPCRPTRQSSVFGRPNKRQSSLACGAEGPDDTSTCTPKVLAVSKI